MATRLIQVVAFVNVPNGDSASAPHTINIQGVAMTPDIVMIDRAGFNVVADSTTVQVENTGSSPDSVNVWLELKHSVTRALGASQTTGLVPRPFYPAVGSGGGSSSPLFPINPTVNDTAEDIPAIVGQYIQVSCENVFVSQVILPLANSAPNGSWCGVIKVAGSAGESSITIQPSGGDTVRDGGNGFTATIAVGLYVTDGISTWTRVATV